MHSHFHEPAFVIFHKAFGFFCAALLGYLYGRRTRGLLPGQSIICSVLALAIWHFLSQLPIFFLFLPSVMAGTIAWLLFSKRVASPPNMDRDARRIPKAALKANIVFGAILPIWPLLVLGDAFLFDQPSSNGTFEAFREMLFWIFLFYPAFYLVGLLLSTIAARCRKPPSDSIVFALIPLLPLFAGVMLLFSPVLMRFF
jgi:hypothetical protein